MSDQEFCTKLVETVKKHACLYNHGLANQQKPALMFCKKIWSLVRLVKVL